MNKVDRARELRKQIEANASAMSDEDALKFPELFPKFSEGMVYSAGQRVRRDDGTLQKTAGDIGKTLGLKVIEILDSLSIPDWKQPTKRKGYKVGDRVKFDGIIYECAENNNIMSPAMNPDGWWEVGQA